MILRPISSPCLCASCGENTRPDWLVTIYAMILPFVRELFADVEKSAAFARAVARVKGGAGRIRVSGLTPTGKALFYALLQRSTSRPVIVIVSDNRAVDELLPVVRSLGDLTGAVAPDAVIGL